MQACVAEREVDRAGMPLVAANLGDELAKMTDEEFWARTGETGLIYRTDDEASARALCADLEARHRGPPYRGRALGFRAEGENVWRVWSDARTTK